MIYLYNEIRNLKVTASLRVPSRFPSIIALRCGECMIKFNEQAANANIIPVLEIQFKRWVLDIFLLFRDLSSH